MTEIHQDDPLEELARENEVTIRLVERLAEASLSLRSDRAEPAGRISEGLRLLRRFRSVHSRRFREGLEPEARVVAMPSCFEHLAALDHNSECDAAWSRVAAALEAYARGDSDGQRRLAVELDALTQEEYDWIRYEGDFPLSCLSTVLPADAASRVGVQFGLTGPEIADLERQIAQYLVDCSSEDGERVDPGPASTTRNRGGALGESTPQPTERHGPSCRCCDPIPEDLA